MPIGLIVFIVFMIVVLQILQVISKRVGRKSLSTYSDPAEAGKRRTPPSLFSNLQNHGINRIWMQAAGNYELAFIRPGEGGLYPGIGGESGDLLVRAFVDEGDQDSPPSTVIEVKYKEPLPLDFLLVQDDPSNLAKAVEGKPRLDKLAGLLASSRSNFALTGSDPKALEALFNPARRNILEELLQTGEKLKMDREGIYWSDRGVINEEAPLSEMLGLLIAAGTVFLEGGRDPY